VRERGGESKGSKKTLLATDHLLKLVKDVQPKAMLKYNKFYIGLQVEGSPQNFVTFRPKKAHVTMTLRLPKRKDIDEQLDEAGLVVLTYSSQWEQYRIRIETDPNEKQREVLLRLVHQAWERLAKV
jgi:hypothetical protein